MIVFGELAEHLRSIHSQLIGMSYLVTIFDKVFEIIQLRQITIIKKQLPLTTIFIRIN